MYVDALAAVGDGTAIFTPQPAEGLEYAHKITVEDARINWADPAEAIDAFVAKKLKGAAVSDPKELKKVSDALARRGYSWSDISEALRRYGAQWED